MRTDEVAAELGVSKTVVWRQIKAGRLLAEKFGRDYRIRREDFERFRRLDRRRGRPKTISYPQQDCRLIAESRATYPTPPAGQP